MIKMQSILSNSRVIYPLLLTLILANGIFIAVNQSQKNQELNSHAANTTNCTVSSAKLTITAQEQQLITDVNNYRTQHGLQQLKNDPALNQAAAWQSTDMLTHNSLSHTDSLGRSPFMRLQDCGYDVTEGYGENIANGTANADTIFTAWKNDPTHNQILLTARFNLTGVDLETSGNNAFWTMDYGTAPPTAPSTPPAPSAITPTLFCLGSNACVPSPTPPLTVGGGGGNTPSPAQPSSDVTVAPSGFPSQAPCSTQASSTGTIHTLSKHHSKNNGLLGQLLLLLLQFIINLINQLIGGNIPPVTAPTPTPTPTPSPTPCPSLIPSPTVILTSPVIGQPSIASPSGIANPSGS